MPIYIQLIRWTDKGRADVATLPDRAEAVVRRIEEHGAKIHGNYMTMGQYDQVAIVEAPDDMTVAKLSMIIAGRGNAVTETLRAFTMDEVRTALEA
ncbi:MAG: GYD domain-containing protein [Actinomycetota bacterium]